MGIREKAESKKNILQNIITMPLLQFILAGVVAYLAYNFLKEEVVQAEDESKIVTVLQSEITLMKDSWAKRWNRPPTEQELEGLINEYVKEAVYYRTALEMGLGENDPRIRRMLAQKLQFVTSELVRPQEPGDGELKRYFRENSEKFTAPPYLTVTQIFFDPDSRGSKTLEDAGAALEVLKRMPEVPENLNEYGDNMMLQNYYPQRTEQELGKLFGSEFANSVFGLSAEEWHGPVLSGYGTHLVYVHNKQVPSAPEFDDVRDAVLSGWMEDKQKELNELYYNGLLRRYEVNIERQESGGRAPE